MTVGTLPENECNLTMFQISNVVFIFQEEYEDSTGNVVTKKTYEDLKRQGLL